MCTSIAALQVAETVAIADCRAPQSAITTALRNPQAAIDVQSAHLHICNLDES
jgi:hypothetical protein